ncbi:MAG: hypothetical protein FWB80_12430 [Defluviitaleaceae bacterium]|nr:hypothetical protein [Defluviitaleaceae bacterium]
MSFKNKMLVGVFFMEAIMISTLIVGILGSWISFFIVLPFYVMGVFLMTGVYRRYIRYVCPVCGAKFNLNKNILGNLFMIVDFVLSSHPREVDATCSECGHSGSCEEVYDTK